MDDMTSHHMTDAPPLELHSVHGRPFASDAAFAPLRPTIAILTSGPATVIDVSVVGAPFSLSHGGNRALPKYGNNLIPGLGSISIPHQPVGLHAALEGGRELVKDRKDPLRRAHP